MFQGFRWLVSGTGQRFQFLHGGTRRGKPARTMKDIIDRMFGGSAESLVMSLVQTRHLTTQKLERLKRRLDQRTEDDHGTD
jgi:predicted transcriptional regulator